MYPWTRIIRRMVDVFIYSFSSLINHSPFSDLCCRAFLSHLGQFGVQCLAQGHWGRQSKGAWDQTTNPLVSGRPPVPHEYQSYYPHILQNNNFMKPKNSNTCSKTTLLLPPHPLCIHICMDIDISVCWFSKFSHLILTVTWYGDTATLRYTLIHWIEFVKKLKLPWLLH